MLRNLETLLFGVLDQDLFNNHNKLHKNIFQNKNALLVVMSDVD